MLSLSGIGCHMPHVEEDGPADELCKSEFYLDVL